MHIMSMCIYFLESEGKLTNEVFLHFTELTVNHKRNHA